MDISWVGAHTNNFESGRAGKKITAIVLHWIVGTLAAADATFNDGRRRASAHYGVGGNRVHQYVREQDTAYHCGNYDFNQRSIGIEHEGGPELPISEATYQTSARLVADIAQRHGIPLDRQHIKMHREISATQCPGTLDIDRVIRDAKAVLNQGGQQMVTLPQKELDELRAARDQHWNELQTANATIANLNATITDRNNQVSQLSSQLATAQTQLTECVSQREILQKTADRVNELIAQNEEYKRQRDTWYEQEDNYKKVIAEQKREIKQLEDKSWGAILRLVVARFKALKGGER